MRFEAERFSSYFRRSMTALGSRQGDSSVAQRLETLVSSPMDALAIDTLLAAEQADSPVEVAMRRARTWLMLALMERDVRGAAPLAEICTAMTRFADRTTALALHEAALPLLERHGRPLDGEGRPQDLLAVGMGKAGGDELNVSSDLDLVFLFRGEGESEGVGGGGRIPTSEWMHRVARRTIALLSEVTADGFVFRVDTRLRPNGDSGPLVGTIGMLEQYFLAQGREWERFAWLKARVIADSGFVGGEARHSDEMLLAGIIEPFVFRRYMDYEAFAALRDLHRKIGSEVARRATRDPQAIDVKLGRGGIREIEFTAQLFQVVRGGRDPELRDRRTLATLETLASRGVVPLDEAHRLDEAYRLLRRTEHALQYRDDQQTHRLPDDASVRADVAAMLRMNPQHFDKAIEAATGAVSGIFDRLMAPSGEGNGNGTDSTPALDEDTLDPEVRRRFETLRNGSRYGAARATTRESVERLLAEAVDAGTSPTGLVRLVDLLETVCRRPAYVALLAQFPQAFARVLRILDWAKWPAEYLTRHPVVLDELLDGGLMEPTDYAEWAQEVSERIAAARIDDAPDVERQMDILREAHHAQVFRLLVQDLEGSLTIERVSDHLSELADRVLDIAIGLVWSQLRLRFRDEPRFAAIAYGRLGGKELGYASDLDLVFLFDDEDDRAHEAYALLAQRLSGWLATRTAAGMLFEIDLRLRPNGDAGLLVSSLAAFDRYQHDAAWPWEHQALTRARFSAGDATIGERFETIRRDVLATRRDLEKLRAEVVAMRRKMHEGHPNRSPLFDLKHDPAGMVDVEFTVQYLVLAYSADHPQLLENRGNIALLRMAAEAGLLDVEVAQAAANAYRSYRRLQHKLRLDDSAYARLPGEQVACERAAVTALWRAVFGGAAR